jgi:pilus assembly protein Flp/PilA
MTGGEATMKRLVRHAKSLRAFLRDDTGATAIEYAMVASLISISIVTVAAGVGTALVDNYYGKVLEGFQK